MKRTHTKRGGGKDGVALIIVLGLLSVLTLLAVAFAIAMRIERMISRNYLNAVRSGHLVETGVRRAMEDININLVRQAFPQWDARNSQSGADDFDDILAGEASNHFPKSIWPEVVAAANACEWTNIYMGDGLTGRIAWVAGNVGGLLDANYAGGAPWCWGTNPAELSLTAFPDITPGMEGVFDLTRRTTHRTFETLTELAALNPGVVSAQPSHFFSYSYDPCPDQVFLKTTYNPGTDNWYEEMDLASPPATMGLRDANLHDKFNVNSISNYVGYTDPGNYAGYTDDNGAGGFMREWYDVVYSLFQQSGVFRPEDTIWNLVNFLDPDRVPQSTAGIRCPWRHSEGGEAVPLFNEIVVRKCAGGPGTYEYEVVVELWFPFAPADVRLEDKFFLEVGIFTNLITDAPEDPTLAADHIMTRRYEPWSFTVPIDEMAYGTYNEFRVYSTDPDSTYEGGAAETIKFPMGGAIGKTNDGTYGNGVNNIYFLARVVKEDNSAHYNGLITNVVDEAMGYDNPGDGENVGGNAVYKRQMVRFSEERGYEVGGPRSNGQVKYWLGPNKGNNASQIDNPADANNGRFSGGTWIGGRDYDPVDHTLGTTNTACENLMQNFEPDAQGLPIMFKNGPMDNIGELGYLFLSNLDDEHPSNESLWYWGTQELMCTNGARLMDLMTVRTLGTNTWERSQRGLVAINTRNKEVIKALIKNQLLGYTNAWSDDLLPVNPAGPQAVADAIVDTQISYGTNYYRYSDLFWGNHEIGCSDDVTTIAEAFRDCMPDRNERNDIRREDPFRNMCELISFRQNLFTIAVAAQVLASDGEPAAEKRAVAVVYRDAYTGRYFTRSMKWLSD